MAFVKTKHFIYLSTLIENIKIELMAPDVYADLHNAVGIYPPSLVYYPKLRLSVNELRVNGLIAKMNIRTESGTTHQIYCTTEKLSTALADVVGKKFPEMVGTDVVYKKITKASLPRKRDRF